MAKASVDVLLFPPSESCDPSRPRVDLLSFMIDPKKPVDQDYQGVTIANDRIFLDGARYGDLERETQDKVRRELQECFAEQGCARSISVKEWAKQTTERQTPRLRLRCTKVCGFGFQVNFDMERKQYYLVRSRGKSGNFCHKCPAPAASKTPPPASHKESEDTADTSTPPASNATVTVEAAKTIPMQQQQHMVDHSYPPLAPAPEPTPSSHAQGQTVVAAPPPPVTSFSVVTTESVPTTIPVMSTTEPATTFATKQDDFDFNDGFPVPGTITADIHQSLPVKGMQHHHSTEHDLNEIPLIIPSQHEMHQAVHPAPVFSFNSDQMARDATAQAELTDFNDMDVSSVDSTDMMIARHFGVGPDDRKASSALSMLSDNSEMPRITESHRSNTRMQVNNEAEYPTVNSLRSFLSMMTGSVNSTMGKAGLFFGRGQSTGSAQMDENMLTLETYFTNTLHRINSVGSRVDKNMGGGDPMDTVNSALSGLSISGMQTMGTMAEERSSPVADGNPFSADFWSPPPAQT